MLVTLSLQLTQVESLSQFKPLALKRSNKDIKKTAISLHYKETQKQLKNSAKQEQISIEALMIKNKGKSEIKLTVLI